MFHAPTSRVLPSIGLALALGAPLSCTKSGDEGSASDEAKSDAAKSESENKGDVENKGDAAKSKSPGAGGLTKVVAEGVSAAATGARLDRGNGLGHFVLPNPSALLDDVRTKASPAKGAGFLNEAMLRSLAGMQLGSRSGVAEHLSLSAPMGCVLVEDATVEIPVACVIGYEGGAAALTTDLGAEGKQGDAEEHVAHYRIDGNDVFLDDLGAQVVISTHTTVFAKAKSYLETNVVGRAASIDEDIEIVLYPKAAMSRYSEQVDSLLSMMKSMPTAPTGNPVSDALADYSRTSMDKSLDFYRDTDQFDFGLSLEEVGLVFSYAAYPTPGSGMQADAQAISSGPIDRSLLEQLPAATWFVQAYTIDWDAAWGMESVSAMRDVFVDAYAEGVGRDGSEVRAGLKAFFEENAELYANDTAMGVMHLPGTQGGVVITRALENPARASWKTWSEGFTPEKILGAEGTKYVTWSFQADALTVDGIAVDRWTVEPGPETKAEIARKADPGLAELERRFGGLKLVFDRVELDDRVLFIFAPGAEEKYIHAAIEAAKGGKGVGTDTGLVALMARNPAPSAVMALNVAGALSWAREVLPSEATREIPPGLGTNLGDFYFSVSYEASGAQHGEMVLSQAMIDQLRKLAD